MASPPAWHQPVLAVEVLESLRPRAGDVMVDGTAGTGGHSLLIMPRLLPEGRLISIDHDAQALNTARERLREFESQVTFVQDDFRHLPEFLKRLGIARVDGLLLDLGMSSLQVDQPARGFSFSKEGPLDMRMDVGQEMTAEAIINEGSADELTRLFTTLGEERYAARIVRRLVEARRRGPITTTTHLARLVAEALPPAARYGRLHSATRVFQALRMAVNDELGALETLLGALPDLLAPGGRAVILSYHSLEDRLVKRAFLQGARENRWALLTKKPVRPSREEVTRNPRARSAKLRAVERLGSDPL